MRYGLSHQRRSEFIEENGVINLHETELYHYLMTLKGPAKDSETDFANEAAKDIQFPKQNRGLS